MKKLTHWISSHKLTVIPISILLIIAVVGAIIISSKKTGPVKNEKSEGTGKISFNIKANEGWTKDSTPAIAHITGSKDDKAKDNDDVDFYHAIKAKSDNHGTSAVVVPAGEYEVKFVSPVNKDGSAYEVYDTGKPVKVKVENIETLTKEDQFKPVTDETCYPNETPVAQDIKKIPADKVTDEMLKNITAEINQAVVKGDDSLKGDKGKEIVQKLEGNVKANPNVSEETKANAEETAKTEAVNEPAKPVHNSKPAEPAKTTSHAPAPKRVESSPKPATPAAKPAAQAPKQSAVKAKVRKPIYKKVWKEEIYNVQYPISGGQKEVGYYCIMAHNGQRVETADEAQAILLECLEKGIETSYIIVPVFENTPVTMGTRQEKRGKWVDEIVGYEWVEQTN